MPVTLCTRLKSKSYMFKFNKYQGWHGILVVVVLRNRGLLKATIYQET